MKADKTQVGGDHYKQEGGEQHWDRVARLKMSWYSANVTKYMERWPLKNGLQDLYKARHYLEKQIEVEEAKLRSTPAKMEPSAMEKAFFYDQDPTGQIYRMIGDPVKINEQTR